MHPDAIATAKIPPNSFANRSPFIKGSVLTIDTSSIRFGCLGHSAWRIGGCSRVSKCPGAIPSQSICGSRQLLPATVVRCGFFACPVSRAPPTLLPSSPPCPVLHPGLGQGGEKLFAITRVARDGLAPVATIQEVRNRSWRFDAHRAGHGAVLRPRQPGVNSAD